MSSKEEGPKKRVELRLETDPTDTRHVIFIKSMMNQGLTLEEAVNKIKQGIKEPEEEKDKKEHLKLMNELNQAIDSIKSQQSRN